MLLDIADRLRTDLQGVPAIGDSLRDLQAAKAAGATPMLVKTGKGFGTVSSPDLDPEVAVFDDLYSAVIHILNTDTYSS